MDITTELNCLHNVFGSLNDQVRARLQAVVNHPSIKTWEDAHCILIQPDLTLWQAVIVVDSTFPRCGRRTDLEGKVLREWERVPTQSLLLDALRYAAYIYRVPGYQKSEPLTAYGF